MIIVTTAAKKSAIGPQYIHPSIPIKCSRIKSSGIKKMICLVRDKKIPFAGFPIDVKNVDVIGCKASYQIKNKKIRKKRTPNSKYSGSPVPNSPRICLGKILYSTKETIEMITPDVAARLNALRTRS